MPRVSSGTAETTRGGGRLVSLDVLRAIAVLLVLGRHLPRLDELARALGPFGGLAVIAQRGGWIGVDLFFVLSGFLVSGLLFREYQRHREIRPGHFLLRRGLKIYPAFYVLLAVTVWARESVYGPAVVCEALFVQNYGPSLWDHTWSLAVEEHFYLAAALLLPLLARRPGEPFARLPKIFFFYIALPVLALRVVNGLVFDYTHRTHLYPTLLRIDSLAFGVLLSYYFHFAHETFLERAGRRRAALVAGGALLLLPPFLWPLETTPFISTAGFTLLYLGSGMILAGLVAEERPAGRLARGLAWIGAYSYSIYLWHLPVRRFVLSSELSAGRAALLYGAGSVVLGVVMAVVIEVPVLRLRDRLLPSRNRPLAADVPEADA